MLELQEIHLNKTLAQMVAASYTACCLKPDGPPGEMCSHAPEQAGRKCTVLGARRTKDESRS